jgi:DNA polymerase-3 subunit beta
MHFKIDRAAFLNELQSLQGVVSAKQLIPALSHLLIETRAGGIAIRATDLDITVKTECAASVREDGSICLPARKLTEIVKSLSRGEIELNTNDLCQAKITSNGSRFKLHGMEAESFPDVEEYSGEYAEIHAEIFSRFIPRVIHAAGQEDSRYALNGAKLEISGERIRMVATDGHRLALVEREGKFAKAMDALIPKKALAELAKLCATGAETLQIGMTDNRIHFKLGKREIVSRLLAGQYPDYSAVLPKDNRNRFTTGREPIFEAIKRVALMADERHRAIKLEIDDGGMRISSESSEIGEAGETLPIDYTGEAITAGFNAVYINDFLNAVEEDEILFEFKDGQSPARLSVNNASEDRCLVIIMPIRL